MPPSPACCARSARSTARSAPARWSWCVPTSARTRRRLTCSSACRRCRATTSRGGWSSGLARRGERSTRLDQAVGDLDLVAGALTLFVFRRGLPHVGLIVGYLLLLWLLVAVLVQVRGTLQASERRAHRLVLSATEYSVQTLYHGVLLFLLPAYWAATTLTSPNVLFLILLAGLALLATFDPWYRRLVHPYPWVGNVFFLVSMFGALNLALPLVGVPPFGALQIAAWVAMVALTPSVCRARGWSWIYGAG